LSKEIKGESLIGLFAAFYTPGPWSGDAGEVDDRTTAGNDEVFYQFMLARGQTRQRREIHTDINVEYQEWDRPYYERRSRFKENGGRF
jgi:hypothetical protein